MKHNTHIRRANEIAEKIFYGQRSKGQEHDKTESYNGGRMRCDSVTIFSVMRLRWLDAVFQ